MQSCLNICTVQKSQITVKMGKCCFLNGVKRMENRTDEALKEAMFMPDSSGYGGRYW